MSSVNTSKLKTLAYSYLGYRNIKEDPEIDKLIEVCLGEVEDLAQFNYIYQEFDYPLDFIKENSIYMKFLEGTRGYYLVLMTLGKRIDDKCRYYSLCDMKKMVVFDAVSSAYLECISDDYEDEIFGSEKTYRFCPGYQGTSTKDLREIFKVLNHTSIGVNLLDSNLMVPLKSMCGIVGIGAAKKKQCGNCATREKCQYRKEGRTCYSEI